MPTGDIANVIERVLGELVHKLEKQKFATTTRPRASSGNAKARHIPAEVRREVAKRDGGRCTFVSDGGKRCEARTRLEYDHIEPVARGGVATVAGVRLLCRAHNQFAAERTYGPEFMRRKREDAQRMAADAKVRKQVKALAQAEAQEQAIAAANAKKEAQAHSKAAAAWV